VGSVTGWIWLVVTPLLLLAVYAFVFGVIFRARVPEGFEIPFWAWLAVALWPWLAFSEGLQRASGAINQHAALISKVALPRHLLVHSNLASVFLLHSVGYLAVLICVELVAADLDWLSLPYALLVIAALYLLALGLGFMLASTQVFLRDIEQLLPTLLLFWFFLTPIIYAPQMMPEVMQGWLWFNPMTWWVEEIREALFLGKRLPDLIVLLMFTGSALVYWIGRRMFDHLSPHFEDFL
jgi:ABC-type polysaccharide/polyol phosphate export permease